MHPTTNLANDLGERLCCVESALEPIWSSRDVLGFARGCHDDRVSRMSGTPVDEVLAVVRVIREVGCRFWLEGGWGVDALVGRQTRPHRDVDIDVDGAFEEEVLTALGSMRYEIETEWGPNRVDRVVPGRGWVDVHPLVIDDEGNARQAALDGGWHELPRSFFTTGRLRDVPVPCVPPTSAVSRTLVPMTAARHF